MAKQKGAARKIRTAKNPAHLRYGKVTGEELRTLAGRLERYAGDLKGLVRVMEESGIESIEVDGITKSGRGTTLIREFVDNADDALNAARRARRREEEADQ